jgi:hypothetical protein
MEGLERPKRLKDLRDECFNKFGVDLDNADIAEQEIEKLKIKGLDLQVKELKELLYKYLELKQKSER